MRLHRWFLLLFLPLLGERVAPSLCVAHAPAKESAIIQCALAIVAVAAALLLAVPVAAAVVLAVAQAAAVAVPVAVAVAVAMFVMVAVVVVLAGAVVVAMALCQRSCWCSSSRREQNPNGSWRSLAGGQQALPQ